MVNTALLRRSIDRVAVTLAICVMAPLLHAQESTNKPAARKNELPPEVAQALAAPEKVILYSLEPWDRATAADHTLHRFKILGETELARKQFQIAIGEFEAAVAGWDGRIAMCFDPRHAIRVTVKGADYDLLLCYECHQLYVYRGDRVIAELGARGSPKVLDAMLTAAKLPLSRSGKELVEQQKAAQGAYARWMDAMPGSLKPLWNVALRNVLSPEVQPLRSALAGQFPDTRARILALYAWFGSGSGPWSGFPSYESVAERLLLDFPTDKLIATASGTRLSEQQTEGAARLFAGWTLYTERPEDRDSVPPDLRKLLLEHTLKSKDEDKVARAKKAFASNYTSPPISRAAMDLIRASKSGDMQAVNTLLVQGAPMDGKDSHGMTALFWAVSGGHKAVVQALLAKGAPVKGAAGADPLMEAAIQGHVEIVRLLLDKGADPNTKGWRGLTPLAAATKERHEEIREMLLKAGARP